MFREWGFLLSEIWVLLALAALVGLLAGWLIWARREAAQVASAPAAQRDDGEAAKLRADLAACTAKGKELAIRVDELERSLTAARMRSEELEAKAASTAAVASPAKAASATSNDTVASVAAPVMASVAPSVETAPSKPKALKAARGGKPDDLKLVKGIGPKLEMLCNKLGFYHFDQIANWTAAEIAWVDENLEGFKGRVTRDEWVVQARDLAAGKPPRAGGEK